MIVSFVILKKKTFFSRTNGFYVWFPSILNSLAQSEGDATRICDVLDANRGLTNNGTLVMYIFLDIILLKLKLFCLVNVLFSLVNKCNTWSTISKHEFH